uniref:SUN domain-containing protein n=1 Tax=Oncorhynchus kisutch TaxID=8019 RepID=A0A8C7CZL9_ONCKI
MHSSHLLFLVLLSSSYSTTALDFEKEHRITPVLESPRMSRRSLRLHSTTGLYGDDSLDSSLNHMYHSASFSAGGASRINSAQTQTSMVNGSFCKDRTIHLDRNDALTAYSKHSSTAARSATNKQALTAPAASPSSTIYARDKSRKHRTGELGNYNGCLQKCFPICLLLLSLWAGILIFNSVPRMGAICQQECDGVLRLNERWARPKKNVQKKSLLHSASTLTEKNTVARSPLSVTNSVTYTLSPCLLPHLVNVLNYLIFSAVWKCLYPLPPPEELPLICSPWLSFIVCSGKSATGAFWWLGTGWYHLATVMSLLNIFVLTRCLPKLLKLLLILLPFLLVLLALWHWGPSSLLSVLPAINITEWRTAYSFSQTPLEPTKDSQPIMAQQPPAVSQVEVILMLQPGSVLVSVDSERLARLEQRLAQLWEKVERGGRRQENQHREVLSLYQAVREQLDTQTDKDSMGLWVSGLLEERLLLLKSGMEKDAALRSELEIGEQYVVQQQGQESRLAQLEVLLQTLTAKTEVQTPRVLNIPPRDNVCSFSVGVDSESRDALLAEVQLLEATLGGIRQDLQGVMGCQGMCDRLDTLHETVSSLLYSQTREKELPESLLQWLSERYVSGVDVHASLTSLELSILQNVTLQLEKSRARQETHSTETVTQTVMHTVGAAGAGMSEEHVQMIVKNALKLYSQDRTGLVDYALESGGGSILSTRCSETYETKTALMSLFGLPLWYFSQSPRVAIQPDVHPGNCWAFQGSHGYLVIRLSMRIVPSAFSLEHIPKSLSPTGTISSAPRQFTVYGLDDEYQEEGKLLGSYTYQDDEDALQTYPVTEENDKAYQIIEVRVLSNWGHPEYTCLYRIRVHGQPSVN